MTDPISINLQDKFAQFSETWQPKIIAELNNYQVKLVKLAGEFVWHEHADTDELFLCLQGCFELHFRDRVVQVKAGELCVVPQGVEHKPLAHEECHVLIIEPAGVINTGAAAGDMTAPNDQWI